MATIYLSSTYGDLIDYREAVYQALRRMRHDVVAMEDYVATDQRPLDKCLADVAACELYIGIFAWRYGHVPHEGNPTNKSITELEYRKANSMNKPCLLFLLDENEAWSPQKMDIVTGEGERGTSITALRQELSLQTTVSFFKTPEELASLASQAVHNWEANATVGGSPQSYASARTKYLENVYKHYNSVQLPLGPAEGFSLQAIFQPLTLRRDPLAAEDLEREKRRTLLGEDASEESSHKLDQPPPVTADNSEDALKKSPLGRLVILGGPGSGKTTTLKYLTGLRAKAALDDPTAPTPIFLSLADLARSGKTLQQYLRDLVEEMGTEGSFADILWKEIEAGRAFICLDSLDEVSPQHRQREKMIEWINTWTTSPENIWIIGSRFTEYKGGQFKRGQFAEWELQPMNHQLRLELAQRLMPELQQLLATADPVHSQTLSAEGFVDQLEHHPQATAWGENPLLLSLAAIVFVQTGHIPTSRTTLYRSVIEAVLRMREPDPLECKELLSLLAELALWLHQTKGRIFTTNDLLEYCTHILKPGVQKPTQIARRIVNTGVLEIVAHETYGFRHQTFQEYLAAVGLARNLTSSNPDRQEETRSLAWSKRTYNRWIEVLRLMIGILAQEFGKAGQTEAQRWLHELIQQRETAEGDPGNLGLALAITSLSEFIAASKSHSSQITQLGKIIVSVWIEELLKASEKRRSSTERRLLSLVSEMRDFPDWLITHVQKQLEVVMKSQNGNSRIVAVEAFGKLGKPITPESFLDALHDSHWEVRRATLGMFGKHIPWQLLLDSLLDPDELVRRAAVIALRRQGNSIPLQHSLDLLHHPNEWVRRATIMTLEAIGDRVPLQPLLGSLLDPHWEVRQEAVTALGALGDRVSLQSLLDSLHDPHSMVRRAVLQVLRALGEHAPLQPLLDSLHDSDVLVRQAAVTTLGELGDRIPLQPLLDSLHDYQALVRQAAVTALGKLGDRIPLQPLLDSLHDPDVLVRQAAITVLGKLGDRAPLQSLLDSLHHPQALVLGATVEVLGSLGDSIPPESLLVALHHPHWTVRQAVVTALGKLGDRAPLQPLLDALHDPHSEVRQAALWALGELGDHASLQPLLDSLHDPHSEIRRAAVTALGKLGDRAPLQPLLDSLHDSDVLVCQSTLWALKRLGNRVPLQPLLDSLLDPHSEVRRAALRALGELGDRAPLQPLLDSLHDPDVLVRQAALLALGKLGDRVPLQPLLDSLHHPHSEVRRAALLALGKLGDRVPLQPLLDSLYDPHSEVCQAALLALGKLGDRVPLQPLLDSLHDPHSEVRRAALRALGELGDRAPLQPLLDSLHDPDVPTRATAIEGLERLGERAPLQPLLDSLYDPHEWVRQAAVKALGALGDRAPLTLLRESLGDEGQAVRQAAIKALKRISPETLLTVIPEALAILRGEPSGMILGSITQSFLADSLGKFGNSSPFLLEKLTQLLDWPYWQVRVKAINALGKIRRNIPDATIKHLLELRRDPDPMMKVVREAADDALAEILSLETGIEND